MSQSPTRQFEKMVNESTHILILLPENPENDFFCSALAIAHFCFYHDIKTTIGFSDPYEQIVSLNFLTRPKTTELTHTIAGSRDLVLSFDTTYNKILGVRTETLKDKVNVYITPERGMIDSRDFSFLPDKFPYDLIITVGATDKEAMGKLYDEIPDIFYELPIINFDNKSANEQFGQVNFVNAVSSSVSEVVSDLFNQLNYHISKECAQSLLTGIISATNSFQNHNTTPHALTLSSQLLENGADQQIIIRNLYRNQTFSLLQLWGRAMKNLGTSQLNDAIVTSLITQNDLTQTKAEKHHIHAILKKIKQNYPKGKVFVLIYEKEHNNFIALINTEKSNIALEHDTTRTIKMLSEYVYEVPLLAHTQDEVCGEVDEIFLNYSEFLKKS
ncbi:MAG: hypothetical protein CR972_00685 [Candidatus Moraniibacteriota bacterium]|nr:MAG: hypothetical protein CR972_00685 [Candidatus Moranbacteria bacterium]